MICTKTVSGSTNIDTRWGTLYEGSVSAGSYAQNFIAKPKTFVAATGGNGCIIEGFGVDTSESSFGTLYLALPSSFPNRDYSLDLLAIGRWK